MTTSDQPEDRAEASINRATYHANQLAMIHTELDTLGVPHNPTEPSYVRVLRALLIARQAPRR